MNEELKSLSRLYYLLSAGLAILVLISMALGVLLLSKLDSSASPIIVFCIYIFPLAFSCVLFKMAKSLGCGKDYKSCVLVSILLCFMFPVGTFFGVYTLVVLKREKNKSLFIS